MLIFVRLNSIHSKLYACIFWHKYPRLHVFLLILARLTSRNMATTP